MKRIITLLYMAALCVAVSAQSVRINLTTEQPKAETGRGDISLAEALKQIDQRQTEKRIHFVFNDLENFRVKSVVEKKSAYAAVKQQCKGLPVKIEMQGDDIFIEAVRKAIVLFGHVEDDFLRIGLPEARIDILNAADSTVAVDSVYRISMARSCRYSSNVPPVKRDYLVHASLEGYADAWQRVSVSNLQEAEVEVPTLKMRKTMTGTLGEVTVTATRIKMFWRGDTLVYDATAFKLPEGSMLDDLIRQLPNTELKDNGEIYVNGRKVDELLLGSRSFLRGNRRVLLENLPYYTVKDIKVYEKASDLSEALGYDVDPKKYVMDVNLKEEYRTGYIANVEAAGGWNPSPALPHVGGGLFVSPSSNSVSKANRAAPSPVGEGRGGVYLGRGFLLGFTDRWRFTLQANANNVNESRHIGQSGSWTPSGMPKEMMTMRSVMAEASYKSKDRNVSSTTMAEFQDNDNTTDMRQSRETFLGRLTPRSHSESRTQSDFQFMKVREDFILRKPFYLNIQCEQVWTRNDKHAGSAFDQYTDSLTTSMHTTSLDKTTSYHGFISIYDAFNLNKKKRLNMSANFFSSWYGFDTERAQRYDMQQFVTPSSTVRHNIDDTSLRRYNVNPSANIRHSLGKHWGLSTNASYIHEDQRAHDYLYHPDTLSLPSQLEGLQVFLDPHNSYDSHYTKNRESLSISLTKSALIELMPGITLVSERFRINVLLSMLQQNLDYQRGAIDTVAHHNALRINPEISYRQKFSKKQRNEFNATAKFETHDLDLLQTVAYRDDSQPLLVNLGNANLKPRQTSNYSLYYANHNGPGKREVSINSSFNYSHRDIAQSVHYNTATGIYTYQSINLGGSYTWTNALRYARHLDKHQRWNVSSSATANLHHSVDQTMLAEETVSHLNAVNTLTLAENAYIQYNKDALNLRATGDFSWRHTAGNLPLEGGARGGHCLNVFDYQYGLNARYTLPRLKTTLSADANMYSRRGYGSSTLNTDDFVVNASISQPFLKGKLIAKIEAFDLLHNLSSTQYEVNAQGRTETWYRSLPHYVMLHVRCMMSRVPKKK